MKKDIVTGRSKSLQRLINLFPKSLRLRFNPRRYVIETFVKASALKTPQGALILDAGAGPVPYKPMFAHCRYQATDVTDPHKLMDFTCSLDDIPRKAGTYDAVLSTEVLEHVEYPQKVMNEMYRILKKDGKLFLTTPQEWMMHQKPYNYYYFTYFGLQSLLKHAGFEKYRIKPMGGFFWFLGDALKFNSLSQQYKRYPLVYYPLRIIAFPFTQLFFPFVLFHLDWIDHTRDWTMGYTVEATK